MTRHSADSAKAKRRTSCAPQLVIMARLPVAGGVKTRLARTIGTTRATWFYRHAVATTLARLGPSPFWRTIIAVTPDCARTASLWPRHCTVMAQGSGTLGQRMQRLLQHQTPGPVVLIGTDIPGIKIADIRNAFRSLGRNDAVFGPAEDGGFWLVGIRRRPSATCLFANVDWSRPSTLAQTLANLTGKRVGQVATLSDVDEADDITRHSQILGRRIIVPRR